MQFLIDLQKKANMNLAEFKTSLSENQPPAAMNIFLKALWHDANGNWEKAHEITQIDEGNYQYDRIHAYLHRKEGDIFNAKWWYNRIKVPFPSESLDDEWEKLVQMYC